MDYASITPIGEEVLKVMRKYESGTFANPSALYYEGLRAKELMKGARESIAKILSAREKEIYFTSGGTESNNLALLGIFQACHQLGHRMSKLNRPHFITTTIEHPSVLEVFKEIERRGGEVTYVPVGEDGIVNTKDIVKALRPSTVLVSVMFANNEIGTIQPIRQIAKVIKTYRNKMSKSVFDKRFGAQSKEKDVSKTDFDIRLPLPYFHTDACQAVLYEELNAVKLGVDLMTLDGIKMHGPRGTSLLYIKDGVNIKPILFGGGQQNGTRSGTENVAGIVGLAKAMEIADKMREKESARLSKIRDYAIGKILKMFPNSTLNGSHESRLPNNINICFPKLDAEFVVISLDVAGISASYSSSCRTLAKNSSSYVVSALDKPNCAESSLRFTLGRDSTKEDIDILVLALQKIIKQN